MPVFQAHIPAGRYTREQKKAIANALNQSLVVALGIPPGDRFIVLSEHGDDELFMDPSFMGMSRSANAMIITVLIGAHRPFDDKKKLLTAIAQQLHECVGVAPDDVFVTLIPVPNENFSFGRGIAQLAGEPAPW